MVNCTTKSDNALLQWFAGENCVSDDQLQDGQALQANIVVSNCATQITSVSGENTKYIYIHAGGQTKNEIHILYYPNQYILVQVSCIEFDEVYQHVQVWTEKIGFCNCWYPKQHELSYLLECE